MDIATVTLTMRRSDVNKANHLLALFKTNKTFYEFKS